MFVVGNTDTAGRLTRQLPGLIVGHFYGPPTAEPAPGSQALADDARAYAGTYLSNRRPYGGLGKFAAMLSNEMKASVTADGHLLTTRDGETQAWPRRATAADSRPSREPRSAPFRPRAAAPCAGSSRTAAAPMTGSVP